MSSNDVSSNDVSSNYVYSNDVSSNTIQYPLDTSLCYPDEITPCTDISYNTSDVSLSNPTEMDTSCSACSSFQLSVQIPCLDVSNVEDTSMITMDMSGYGYDIQTIACKYNDGILVQTNITMLDQSCAQMDFVHQQLTQQVASLLRSKNEFGPIDIIPESIIPIVTSSLSPFFTELNDFSVADDVPEPSEAHSKTIENSYSDSRIVEESFLEFTQSLQTATSKLRKKITRFIHFPKDMKK